jgi:hypothetical protein
MVKTIGLEPLRKHISYTLYSGFVKNAIRPISTLEIAHPERGKSTEARRFDCIGAIEVQELSAYGILREFKNMPPRERQHFHHIIIPDLEKIASKSRRFKLELLSAIRVISEEGYLRSWVKGMHFEFDKRLNVGFILCTTPEDIAHHSDIYKSSSFLSRFIPFTYDFSSDLKAEILNFVEQEDRLTEDKTYLKREEGVDVRLPSYYTGVLTPYAKALACAVNEFAKKPDLDSDRVFGVRFKENLMTYLKAIALYDGCYRVRQQHFDEFRELFHFMNFRFNNIDEERGLVA